MTMLSPYEPRSNDCWDDDSDLPGEPVSLLDLLGALVLAIPALVIFSIVQLILVFGLCLSECFKPLAADGQSGERRSALPYIVACLAVVALVSWWLVARPRPAPAPARSLITAISPMPTRPRVPTPMVPAAGLPIRTSGSGCTQLATPAPPAWRNGYCASSAPSPASPAARPALPPTPTPAFRSLRLPVDDFEPQPIDGQPVYFYNRLEGDRGAINNALLTFGAGQMTTTVSTGNIWAGAWLSLNHPIREQLSINLDAVLPHQILPEYQSAVTGIEAKVAAGTQGRPFRLELKDCGALQWTGEALLSGEPQSVAFNLTNVGPANELLWVLDRAHAGDFVVLDSITFTVTSRITDTATAGFVWSYGQLLSNWNSESGLVRDKAREASGEFDAVQATGSLAAATALAEQLGVISHDGAVQIVNQVARALLDDLPRQHGLWPHWVRGGADGMPFIVPGTEYSSVDTVIAALSLLAGQSGLGLDTSPTEQMLREIDWPDLLQSNGIRHGYTEAGELLPYAWDTFGGESWLVALAYAAASGQVAPLAYPSPPTANGSGFIDEISWLIVPPPAGLDAWGNDWRAHRSANAEAQMAYFSARYPASCLARAGFFGLSAAEGPAPERVPPSDIYQAFGVGGRFAGPNDGSGLWGAPAVAPHYAGMIASLHPLMATGMWDQLIRTGFVTPLTNVESLFFEDQANCDPGSMTWNSLKGSWNLALQTLGWGRYLVQRRGEIPVLWQAVTENPFLAKGYAVLASGGPVLGPARERTFLPLTPGEAR